MKLKNNIKTNAEIQLPYNIIPKNPFAIKDIPTTTKKAVEATL